MRINKFFLWAFVALLASCATAGFTACGGDDADEPTQNQPGNSEGDNNDNKPAEPASVFARGADVSWLTLAEARGEKFYNSQSQAVDCLQLLKDECGVNSIRLRIWVDPADGYCGIEDVMKKALRAKALGMAVMADFHLADSWADPGKQPVPKAWSGKSGEAMAAEIRAHVSGSLTRMKQEGIDVRWVQIGNETTNGMLWESGRVAGTSAGDFPLYLNAGYEASKSVFPDAQVIVHLDCGNKADTYRWFFDLITARGGKFDMIGMSLYPEMGTWPETTDETAVTNCISNINEVARRYNKPVMLCEIGFHYTRGAEAARIIRRFMDNRGENLKGIFYWEPQASEGFNGGYNKGAFINGHPNGALAPFLQ